MQYFEKQILRINKDAESFLSGTVGIILNSARVG